MDQLLLLSPTAKADAGPTMLVVMTSSRPIMTPAAVERFSTSPPQLSNNGRACIKIRCSSNIQESSWLPAGQVDTEDLQSSDWGEGTETGIVLVGQLLCFVESLGWLRTGLEDSILCMLKVFVSFPSQSQEVRVLELYRRFCCK